MAVFTAAGGMFDAERAGVLQADAERFGDGGGKMVAAHRQAFREKEADSLGDRHAGSAAADVHIHADGLLVRGPAVDAGEAIDECELGHVHSDDVEARPFRGGDELIDPARVGGHHHDVKARIVLVRDLAGDRVTEQSVRRVKGKFQPSLCLNGVLELVLLHVFDRKVLGVDDGRRQSEDGAAAVEFAVDQEIAGGFGEELEPGVGVVANLGGHLRAGGGEKLEVVTFGLDLGEAKRAGAEIDADRMRGRREDVLDESQHWPKLRLTPLSVGIDGRGSDGDGMKEFGGDGIGDRQAAFR